MEKRTKVENFVVHTTVYLLEPVVAPKEKPVKKYEPTRKDLWWFLVAMGIMTAGCCLTLYGLIEFIELVADKLGGLL